MIDSLMQTFTGGDDALLMTLVIGLLAGGLAIILGLLAFGNAAGDAYKRRLKRVENANRAVVRYSTEAVTIRRSDAFSSNSIIDILIKRLIPRPENLRAKLARAGLRISVSTYLIINVVTGALAFLGLQPIPILPTAGAVLFGCFIGIVLPTLGLMFLVARRRQKFIANFPEAIDLMVRGIKSGLPITETLKIVSDELPDPVSGEFRQVTDAVRLGKNLDDALWDTARRLDLPEFNFFTVSLSIQSETGGNLAETLENLSNVLRGRRQMKLKIKALASEPKASAYIIGSLPFIMFALIYVMSPDYAMKLFQDPRGWMMVAGGSVSFLIGIGVMIKMVRFEI